MSKLKEVPFSLEYEQHTLSAFMSHQDAPLATKKTGLPSINDFHLEEHQIVWTEIHECLFEDVNPSFAEITARLSKKQLLDKLPDGPLYLTDLMNYFIPESAISRHVRELKELARRRDAITTGTKMASEAYNLKRPVTQILGDAMHDIQDISQETGSALESVGEIAESYLDRITAYQQGNKPPVVATGLADVDRKLNGGFFGPQLIYLAARPGMGKTSLALEIAKNAGNNGQLSLFFSLEMSKAQLMDRLVAGETGLSATDIERGNLSVSDLEKVLSAMADVENMPLKISDSNCYTVADIAQQCEVELAFQDIGVVFIDFIQLMQGEGYNGNERMTNISRDLKRLSKRLGCPVVVLSQLSRAVEGRGDKRPTLPDLRESGSLEQDADIVVFLYRDDYYKPDSEVPNETEFIIAKNKQGPTGLAKLFFDKAGFKFENLTLDTDPNSYSQTEIVVQESEDGFTF